MRYHILFWITIFTLLGTEYVSGQTVQGSATMTAKADVVFPMTVSAGDPIDLGTIIQGTSKHVDALTKSVDASAETTTGSKDGLISGGEQRGWVRLTGGPIDGRFSVEVTVPNALTGSGDNTKSLPIRFDNNPGGPTKIGFNGAIVDAFPNITDDLTNNAAGYTKYLPNGGDGSVNDEWTSNNFNADTAPDGFTGSGSTYFLGNNSLFEIRSQNSGVYLVLGAMVEAGADQAVDTYQGNVTVTFTLEN